MHGMENVKDKYGLFCSNLFIWYW